MAGNGEVWGQNGANLLMGADFFLGQNPELRSRKGHFSVEKCKHSPCTRFSVLAGAALEGRPLVARTGARGERARKG